MVKIGLITNKWKKNCNNSARVKIFFYFCRPKKVKLKNTKKCTQL